MYELFTDRARKVMQLANEEAQLLNHEYIGTEHLLLGLIREGKGIAAVLLEQLDIDLATASAELEKYVQRGPDMVTMGKLPLTPRTKNTLTLSAEEARHLSHNYIGTEHLLLGLLRETEGLASQVLQSLGLKLDQVREEILSLLGTNIPKNSPDAEWTSYPDSENVRQKDINVLRILDAAANRACEGLRVIEDYTRFGLDDSHLTCLAKNLRHDLADCLSTFSLAERHEARETTQDVGTEISTASETSRLDTRSVYTASCERVKQSLRSLEEFGKVHHPTTAKRIEALRYRFYTLERVLGITNDSQERLADVNLCVLTDGCDSIDQFRTLAKQLIAAGVPMIQLRQKNLTDAELAEHTHLRVKLLRQLAADCELIIIVNDRPDIAAAVSADGVHLGQGDLSVKDARTILGTGKLIGVSTHSIEQARAAVLDGANYLGAGPTFPSTTKEFDQFPGLEYLREVAQEITLPTFVIGGIRAENLPQVQATGSSRIAVSGAITYAENPEDSAKQLIAALQKSHEQT